MADATELKEVKVKISIDDSEVDKLIRKFKKAIKLEKELQAISSSKESSNSIDLDGHSIAKTTIKAIAHSTIRDKQ